jgi:hypothetical protein
MRSAAFSLALLLIASVAPSVASAAKNGPFRASQQNALAAQNRALSQQNRALKQEVFTLKKADLEAEVKKEEALYTDRNTFGRLGTALGLGYVAFTGVLVHMGHGDPTANAIVATNAVASLGFLGAARYSAHQAKQVAVKVANLKSRLGALISRGPK